MERNRTYVIALDINSPDVDLARLKLLFESTDGIGTWWNYIPGCFLVTSDLDPEALSDVLRTVTGQAHLLVMAANPGDSAGWLPNRSWKWIVEREADLPQELVK